METVSHKNGWQREPLKTGLGLPDIIAMLKRRWPFLVAGPFVLGLIAIAVVSVLPPRYSATATVYIDPREKMIIDMDQVVSALKANNRTIESEVQIAKTRDIMRRVIVALDLVHDPEFLAPDERPGEAPGPPHKAGTQLAADTTAPATQNRPAQHVLEALSPKDRYLLFRNLADAITVKRRATSYLIDITARSRSAYKAAQIANKVAQAYLAHQRDAKLAEVRQASSWLKARVEEQRRLVTRLEREIERYKAKHNFVAIEGHTLKEKQLARLMEQTILARSKTAGARARYLRVRQLSWSAPLSASLDDVLRNPTITLLKKAYTDATRKHAELATKYRNAHPTLIKARAEIRAIRTQMELEVKRIISNFRNDYIVARKREKALLESLEQLKKKNALSNRKRIHLMELQRQAKAHGTIYESFLARYRQTIEQQSLQMADARFIEKARPSIYPTFPKKKKLVALAAVAGMAIGGGLALLLEFLAKGLRKCAQVETALRLPCLVPLADMSRQKADGQPAISPDRIMQQAPRSPYATAIRALRLELEKCRPKTSQEADKARTTPQIILVTAAQGGEGTATLAANLAAQYGIMAHKVLLIDGHLTSGHLSRSFSCDQTRNQALEKPAGLTACLGGSAAIPDLILRHEETGPDFLPAGQGQSPDAVSSNLLAGPQLTQMFDQLRSRYDTILVAGPPLLDGIDAAILAEAADLILFVIKWGATPAQTANEALHKLGANITKVAGAVLNRVDPDW